jgi:2-pyrone-4,6-dicarboxylate lactonase
MTQHTSAQDKAPLLTYKQQPTTPTLPLPPNSCDAHVHIFGPGTRFSYASDRSWTPVDAPKETLFALHRQMGVSRCVIVQSLIHGFDNRVVEDAIEISERRYLGVALVPVNVADSELRRLADAGFKGVRFHFMNQAMVNNTMADILALTQRLKPLGLHLQVHFESSMIHTLSQTLPHSAVPVVIDHMGRVDAALGAEHADFAALHELLKNPLFFVKVSGIDRIDPSPPYLQGVPLARTLVESYPDRCVWGTDWPHPNHNHIPDDGVLVDALAHIATSQARLEQLLVHNPQHLYGFNT